MIVKLHLHARERLLERGVTELEVIETVETGEQFPVKFGRTGFRKNFQFGQTWRGRVYATKQVEAYAVEENAGRLVITVLAKYF